MIRNIMNLLFFNNRKNMRIAIDITETFNLFLML